MNLDNALDYIKDRRMIINPNSKFIETLRKYDKKIEK